MEHEQEILEALDLLAEQQAEAVTHIGMIEGLLLFLVVVVLCRYVYKFFRIFF